MRIARPQKCGTTAGNRPTSSFGRVNAFKVRIRDLPAHDRPDQGILAIFTDGQENASRRYLDILCGTYVVRQLPPWFENLKKRQVKAPKVYIRDSGILHALLNIPDAVALESHPKLGASWEGFAIEQILSITGDREAYFWATHGGAELDLLVFHAGERLGFEFKYSEKPSTSKSMHIAASDLGLDHLYVVHPGKHSFPLTETITASTLADLLDLLTPLP